MHRITAHILILLLLSVPFTVPAEQEGQGFDRYQVIIDKAIFGKAPVNTTPTVTPTAPAGPSFINDYRLCMINELNDGSVRVGLLNTKTQYSFILQEGETDANEAVELVSADYTNEEVKLSKNGEVRSLSIDRNLVIAPTQPAPATSTTTSKNGPPTAAPQANVKSYLERRAERRRQLVEAMRKREQAKPKYSGKELEEHLKEYQKEVIKRGLPPLPGVPAPGDASAPPPGRNLRPQ